MFLRTFQSIAALSVFSTASAPPSMKSMRSSGGIPTTRQKVSTKTRVAFRVNVGVRDLDLGRAQEIGFHLRLVEMRMIKPDRVRAEKAVEIDQLLIVRGIVKIRAVALLEIDHDPKTIEQDVLGDLPEHGRFRFGIGFLARTDATARRSAGRLGEHGWHTHPLRVVGGEILVNRTAG